MPAQGRKGVIPIGKKVEDLKGGDKIKIGGHKVTVKTVRDEGDEIRIIAEGRYGRIQETWNRGETPR